MALFVGIDVGTSGVRAAALDEAGEMIGQGAAAMTPETRRDPAVWWAALEQAIGQLLQGVDGTTVTALAVDGTSGTVLAVDRDGRPLGPALMYNDPVEDRAILDRVAAAAPETSAAHGPTSGLAKAIRLQDQPGTAAILHQADWIAGRMTGRFDRSDENNALKTGYDPVARRWPDWIARTAAKRELLPEVLAPGTALDPMRPAVAEGLGLPRDVTVVAGTTDGCASFLATGASAAGEAVTALGSTLVVKLLSDRPLFAPAFGLYSHRIGDSWLAGGASNSGGAVLAEFFEPGQLAALSRKIEPARPSGLDYYPLARPGERFPINDPGMAPRLTPRPLDDVTFLQGLFEGMARIEALAYERLLELGAPPLTSLRTVGGGAGNAAWTAIRQQALSVPFLAARSDEAAVGTARLARAAVLGSL